MSDTPTAAATIKTWFETGDIPTQSQFSDFISSYANLIDNNQKDGVATGITAFAGGGQGSATALTKRFNRVDICATEGDSVKLPTPGVSTVVVVLPEGAEATAIYPQSGGQIYGLSVNAADLIPPFYYAVYIGINTSVWIRFLYSLYGFPLVDSNSVKMLQSLGSDIKAEPLSGFSSITAATAMGNQTVYYIPVKVNTPFTATGAYVYQGVQGNYTGDNYNGIGLYSFSGGVITLIASSTNDSEIWKATSQTWIKKAFSATVFLEPGTYFLALLYCRSAQTTGPSMGRGDALYNAGINTGLFTNSSLFMAQLAAQTSLSSPLNMSALTQSVHNYYASLY